MQSCTCRLPCFKSILIGSQARSFGALSLNRLFLCPGLDQDREWWSSRLILGLIPSCFLGRRHYESLFVPRLRRRGVVSQLGWRIVGIAGFDRCCSSLIKQWRLEDRIYSTLQFLRLFSFWWVLRTVAPGIPSCRSWSPWAQGCPWDARWVGWWCLLGTWGLISRKCWLGHRMDLLISITIQTPGWSRMLSSVLNLLLLTYCVPPWTLSEHTEQLFR